MARKKELMELENPSMEGNNPLDGTGTEAVAFPGEGEGTPPEADGDGMDLNELLGSMDQEPAAAPDLAEGGELPELTEEEIFGEGPEGSDGTGTTHGADEESNVSEEAQPEQAALSETGNASAKTRRTTRRKKEEPSAETDGDAQKAETETLEGMEAVADSVPDPLATDADTDKSGLADDTAEKAEETIPQEETEPTGAGLEDTPFPSAEGIAGAMARSMTSPSRRTAARGRKEEAPVLTLEVRGEVETEESRGDAIWHEIHNAYRTRRILTGQLGGIEQTDNGKTITIVDYKGFRIVIPLKEMMINVGRSPSGQEYAELMLRQNKILGNMLGGRRSTLS